MRVTVVKLCLLYTRMQVPVNVDLVRKEPLIEASVARLDLGWKSYAFVSSYLGGARAVGNSLAAKIYKLKKSEETEKDKGCKKDSERTETAGVATI